MSTSSLTLLPHGKQSFTIGLHEDDGRQGSVERITAHSTDDQLIFSDLSYEFVLNREDIADIRDVRVYINDAREASTYNNGRICFPNKGISDRRIFLDCFGFVELSFTLVMTDGSECTLCSEYLPVLVRRGQLNEAVKAMVSYVYHHQDTLLLNGEPKPRDLAGLKDGGYKSLATQILLAEEIATLYETNYGYFKANSRSHLEKVAIVDRLERLQRVSPATIEYIVTHPEQLRPVNSNTGVRVGNRIYHPVKTLSQQNVNAYDIEENIVVVGFLRKMVDEVALLYERCKDLLQRIPDDEDYSTDYIHSSFFMFSSTRHMLENWLQQLSKLLDKYTQLWGLYHVALNVTDKPLSSPPRATPIFMSVPQYNQIFVRIYQWINYGVYDFAQENFMLSFIKISSLYENYLLVKLACFLQECGYTLADAKRCIYPIPRGAKYKNTNCSNTFQFYNSQHRITLYYQPVVYDKDQSSVNGIRLYRNNSIPVALREDDYEGNNYRQAENTYYVPDYIVKIENENETRYLIIDAKFSNLGNVRGRYLKDLVFKYLFSISPVYDTDKVVGMGVLYGKCTDQDQLKTAYDKQLPDNQITPFVELVPLIEGVQNEEQFNKLDVMFKKLIG